MFDDRLKFLRTNKKMNMKQVARELNIPYTTYVGYEKNEREPNSEILVQLADYFNCSVDYLIGRCSDSSIKSNSNNVVSIVGLTNHEENVISAYRQKTEMQPAVDKLLGVESDCELIPTLSAARDNGTENTIKERMVPDLSKFPIDDSGEL